LAKRTTVDKERVSDNDAWFAQQLAYIYENGLCSTASITGFEMNLTMILGSICSAVSLEKAVVTYIYVF